MTNIAEKIQTEFGSRENAQAITDALASAENATLEAQRKLREATALINANEIGNETEMLQLKAAEGSLQFAAVQLSNSFVNWDHIRDARQMFKPGYRGTLTSN